MSEQNVETIQGVYRAAANGEASGLRWLDERFALERRSVPELSGIEETVDDPKWKPERYIDLHEKVLVRVKLSGRGSQTGHAIEARIAHLWSIREGRTARLAVYHEWHSGLEAAGLEE
jgi:ketosteroid isomerase-like protein